MKKPFLMIPLIGAVALGGCSTTNWTTTETVLGGAAVGALVGTGLGVGVAAIGGTNLWTGALVGAGVGGGLGAAGGAVANEPLY
jgi:hypothetical protein